MTADLRIGTCGYSFPDWKGPVYPPALRPSMYLVYYARSLGFTAVEIDSSFYRMPTVPLVEALMQKTAPGFLFTLKAYRGMTHDIWQAMKPAGGGHPAFPDVSSGLKTADMLSPLFQEFHTAALALQKAGRLGTVVLQYPPWFKDTPRDRDFLLMTKELLPGLPLSIEFRDETWHQGDALSFLEQATLGYVAVDEPQLRNLIPLVPAVTSDIAYLRLHGRNPKWFGASREERYDYLYSTTELEEMRPSIDHMARRARLMFVMTNNCHRGQAVQNAKDLQQMLLFGDTRPVEGIDSTS
jgi:uncharacterized protein YecE (DUF72 family)